jgi:hypothetical protein
MSEYKFFLFHKLLVVGLNGLMVAALFIAMYRASLYPDDFTPTFLKTLFSLLIPTMVLGLLGKLYLRNRSNTSDTSDASNVLT